ncbi:AraC family transcriptional regulator [Isoalcanivorax indicus]|uniref:AraC family transcriptional regulator n=1 Tax=Isoalcanivorax indicus TaxID=2202653 RepID=UPI000DB91A45|nr:AraC family transcriptional regulator [Isoalcanivorax indicus]
MYRADSMAFEVPIISVRYVRAFVSFVESRGVSRQMLLNGTGVREATLDDPNRFFSMVQVVRVLSRAEELLEDEQSGFAFGQRLDLQGHGVLGFALLQKRDPRTLIRMIVDYLRVALPIMDMRIKCFGDEVCIALADTWELGSLRPFVAKMYMGSIHTLASLVCRDFVFEFDFQADRNAAAWATLVRGAEVRFGCNENRIVMPLSGYRPWGSDESLARRLAAVRSRESIGTDSPGKTATPPSGSAVEVVVRVKQHVMNNPGRNGSLDRVAEELGMSPRSVRYHLNLAGFAFHDIRNSIRETYATRYLKDTRLPLSRIAEKVGYSDQASFTKAYRAWTGKTPGDVRRASRVL